MHQSNYSISLVEYSLIRRGGHPRTAASPASTSPGAASAASFAASAASVAASAAAYAAASAGRQFSCWSDELGPERVRGAWSPDCENS